VASPVGEVLTPVERVVLAALLEVVLPSTSGPGAREAHAVDYVARRLAGRDDEWLVRVRAAVVAAAGDEDGFVARAAADDGPDRELFRRLRSWAWEGFLCDPTRGGNDRGVGWHRFGADGHPKGRRADVEPPSAPGAARGARPSRTSDRP